MEKDPRTSTTIQAMPFIPGKVGLTASTPMTDVNIIMCTADGNVTVTDENSTPATLYMTAESLPRAIPPRCTVVINAGTFDVA